MSGAQPKWAITATGMVSPVGANAAQSFTSVCAEVCRKRERPDLYNCLADAEEIDDGQTLVASAIHHLDTRHRDQNRPAEWLASLAAQAYRDLRREALIPAEERDGIGLFVSLPSSHDAGCDDLVASFSYHFHNEASQDPLPCEVYEQIGHSGALKLCQDACQLLDAGTIRYAIVGGVDSYLFPERLARLDRDYRLYSSRNVDGFCPKEATAFFLIKPKTQTKQHKLAP